MYRVLVTLLLLLTWVAPQAHAAGGTHIGVVDFKQFMQDSIAGKNVQDQLRQNGEKLKLELEKVEAELKEAQERYHREAPLWDRKKKEQESKQFQTKVNEFRRLKAKKEKEFAEYRFKLLNKLQEGLILEAEKLAKEKGYLLIVEKQSGKILYVDRALDVTAEIIGKHDHLKTGE